MSPSPTIEIIVLAAGASTRLGKPKQLLLYEGRTLLRRTIDTALLTNAHSVHVVLGYKSEQMNLEITGCPVDIIINPYWQAGISTSIRSGMQSLKPNTEAVLIVLCDQPKLSAGVLNKLIDTYAVTRAPIVTSTYAGTVGVPTLYDRRIFSELLDLSGDHGAKSIIERHASDRVEIDFIGGEVDIDTYTDQGYLTT
jgi:molybdenum cofactor cytidylyltransferase